MNNDLAYTLKVKQQELKVYWHIFTPEERQRRQQEIQAIQNQLSQGQPVGQGQPNNMGTFSPNQAMGTFSTKHKKSINTENILGMNVMAAVAYILIFVSIIVLCGAVMPFMTDAIKTVIIFGVSTLMTAVGCFLLIHKKNAWAIILTHCGLICLFISNMVSNMVLMTLPDMITYSMTFLWLLFTIFISKKYSDSISITCYLGLIFTSVLSVSLAEPYESSGLSFTVLLVTAAIVGISKTYKDKAWKNIPRDITVLIVTSNIFNALTTGVNRDDVLIIIVALITSILLIMYNIQRFVAYNVQKNDISFSVVTLLSWTPYLSLDTWFSYKNLLVTDSVKTYSIIIILTVSIILTLDKFKDNILQILVTNIILPIALIAVVLQSSLGAIIGIVPIIIYFNYKGDKENNIVYRSLAVYLLGLQCASIPVVEETIHHLTIGKILDELTWTVLTTDVWRLFFTVIQVILCLISIGYISYTNREDKYNPIIRLVYLIIGYFGILSFGVFNIVDIIQDIGYLEDSMGTIMIICSTLYMIYAIVNHNKKDISDIAVRVANETMICIIVLLSIIAPESYFVYKEVSCVSVLILAALNIKVYDIDKQYLNLYNFYKYTMLSWVVTMELFRIGFLTSTVSIAIALAAIVYGIKQKQPHLRVYGLILTIISVIKITMFDIGSKSTIGKAICLFACGVMCLIISFVYSLLEKAQQNKTEVRPNENLSMYNENQNFQEHN